MLSSTLLRRFLGLYGSAVVLMFFSEMFFLNEGPVIDAIAKLQGNPLSVVLYLAEFSLFYCFFAYVMLYVIDRYAVRTVMGIFLAGALFGWMAEAIIVPIAYEAVPVSLIWPSVSWHGLVDVVFGWYMVRTVMRLNRPLLSVGMFIVLGVIWGGWATWFWAEPDVLQPVIPGEFMLFTFATSLWWIGGMILADAAGWVAFTPGKWERRIVFGGLGLFFILMAVPYLPFSLALPPLIWLTVRALSRQPETDVDRLRFLREDRPARWQYLLAILTPIVASAVYPIFYEAQVMIPAEDVIFILFCTGTLMLIGGLTGPLRRWPGHSKARAPKSVTVSSSTR